MPSDDIAAKLALRLGDRATRVLPRHESDVAPLSPMQFGLWFTHLRDPGSADHHRTTIVEVTGPLDIGQLRSALIALCHRHEPLRTVYGFDDDVAFQRVLEAFSPVVVVVDSEGDDGAVDRCIAAADSQIFELASVPPFAVTVVRHGSDRHTIIFAIAHIAFDGTSEPLLVRDLDALYHGTPLVDLPARYRDWAVWRDADANSKIAAADCAWWVDQLTRPLPPLVVPPSWTCATQGPDAAIALTSDLSDAVRGLARSLRVTPFAVAMVAWANVLSDADCTDVIVNVPIEGRRFDEVRDLVGCFIANMPLRIDIASLGVGRERIAAMHHLLNTAHDRSRCSNTAVGAGLRSVTYRAEPLASALSAQWRRFESRETRGSSTTFAAVPRPPVGDGVHLRVDEVDQRIVVRLGARAVQDRWLDADRVGGQFVAALSELVVDPETSALERIPRDRSSQSIVARVDELCGRDPDALCLLGVDRSWSRREFSESVRDAMETMIRRGVCRGDVVGVSISGAYGVIALHAAWRLGAVCAPIEASSPPKYLDHIDALAAPKVVIRHRADLYIGDALTRYSGQALFPDRVVMPTTSTASIAQSAIGYLLFTSGTTGTPSGVVFSRNAIEAYTTAARDRYALTESDRVLLAHSLAFDASLSELFAAMTAGAVLVERSDEFPGSVRQMFATLTKHEISVIDIPTSLWHAIIDELGLDQILAPPKLRLVVIGGEAARSDAVLRWKADFPTVRLVNGYGPTEATVEVVTCDLSNELLEIDRRVGAPIGTDIAGVTTALIDRDGRVVPGVGEGELLVTGAQLALGYLGDQARTAARFVYGQGDMEGHRWYRTGDWIRRDAAGILHFVHRIDGQLKVRGYRVEPEEIELALLEHDRVREATVVMVDGALVAHVLAIGVDAERCEDADVVGLSAELRALTLSRLPEYLVPARVVVHDRFPRTPGGKPNRAVLRAMHFGDHVGEGPSERNVDDDTLSDHCVEGVHSRSIGEMLDIWNAVLPSPITADDDFFMSGGTSLHAVRLIGALERHFQIDVGLSELFAAPTARSMADAFGARIGSDDLAFLAGRLPDGVVCLATGPATISPLFLFPPGGAELLAYRNLAGCFEGHRTVLTFELPGLDGVAMPLAELDELVHWHVERIAAVQPVGPYILSGYSLGAFVAVESARVLSATQSVGFLAMIDPNTDIAMRGLRRWRKGQSDRTLATILRAGVKRRVQRWFTQGRAKGLEGKIRSPEESFELVGHRLRNAWLQWSRAPYDGPIVVFRATGTVQNPIAIVDPDPVAAFAPAHRIVPVPGTHSKRDSVLNATNSVVLGAELQKAIREAQC